MMTSRNLRLWVGLVILLVAAGVRLWALQDAPPGLQHDEIYNVQDGRLSVEQGNFPIYYPNNQGREGSFIWLMGLSYRLFGATLIAVKFLPFAFGMLTVALLFRVFGMAYGYRTGTLSAALCAVSFWAIFASRVGLRAVMLPVFVLLVAWGLWSICTRRRIAWRYVLLTGLALGAAIYTYLSSFVLYIGFAGFVVGLLLFNRRLLRRRFFALAAVGLLGFVIASPMISFRLTDPEAQSRVENITRPWNAFKAGDSAELVDNAWRLAGMPVFTGDPEWRYNVAERPLFGTPFGLLVYVGLVSAFWNIRRYPLNMLLLVLATAGLIPSLLTVQAPSFLRSIIVLPSVMLFMALGIETVAQLAARLLLRSNYSQLAWALGGVVIAVTAMTDWPAYFSVWTRSDEVQSIYRDDLEQLAAYLRAHNVPLALVSTTETNLDAMVYQYANPPASSEVVFFSGRTNIVLSESPTLLFVSPFSPISEAHADWLTPINGTAYMGKVPSQDGDTAFDIYRLNDTHSAVSERLNTVSQYTVYLGPADGFPSADVQDWGQPLSLPVNFGNVIELVGVEVPRMAIFNEYDGVNLQLYFHPLVSGTGLPVNVFAHLLRLDGTIAAQRDLMGVSPADWNPETVFIQDNFIVTGPQPTGSYILVMGLYNWMTGERLSVIDQEGTPLGDRLVLAAVDVIARQ